MPFKVFEENGTTRAIVTDFLVMGEREEIHETKSGYFSQEFLYKSGLWLKYYPSFPYLVVEPDGTGFKRTPLKEFLIKYGNVEPDGPKKKYTWWQIKLSEIFYKAASKFV